MRFNIFFIFIFISILQLRSQNIERILGDYSVRLDSLASDEIKYSNIHISLKCNDTVTISKISGFDVQATVIQDSIDIFTQLFSSTCGNYPDFVFGGGKFINDTIKFYYVRGSCTAFKVECIAVKLKTNLSYQNAQNQIALSISPNPFVDIINVSYNSPNSTDRLALNLYSTTGLLSKRIEIKENGQSTKTISLEDINKGIYYGVVFLNDKWINSIKLIKK